MAVSVEKSFTLQKSEEIFNAAKVSLLSPSSSHFFFAHSDGARLVGWLVRFGALTLKKQLLPLIFCALIFIAWLQPTSNLAGLRTNTRSAVFWLPINASVMGCFAD